MEGEELREVQGGIKGVEKTGEAADGRDREGGVVEKGREMRGEE